jgi:hypothetical protein
LGAGLLTADEAGRFLQGTAISVNIQPQGNPLGSPSAAVAEMQRAMDAWNAVPESRVTIQAGNTAYNYTASHSQSPAQSYSGTNVILFDDPYGDISDPVNCSGVLLVGTVPRDAVDRFARKGHGYVDGVCAVRTEDPGAGCLGLHSAIAKTDQVPGPDDRESRGSRSLAAGNYQT